MPHPLPLAITLLLYREYYSFRSGKEDPAAILELPDGAWKDKILKTKLGFMGGYFDCHAKSWYDYYSKKHGYSIANDSLVFVNCTYKTKTWALAIYPSKSPRGSSRRGPELEKFRKETTDLPNQCVAVEVSSIVLATSSFKKSVSFLTKVMSKISGVH